jgi:hypothetical protein
MIKFTIAVSIILLTILTAPSLVSADETYICRFAGTVQLNGEAVPDGTIITAIVGDDEYTTITPTGYGPSTYSVAVEPPAGISYPDGTTVHFKIHTITAHQTSTLRQGKNIRLDLTATGTLPTPDLPATSTSSGTNTGLLVGLIFACMAEITVVGGVAYIVIHDWDG